MKGQGTIVVVAVVFTTIVMLMIGIYVGMISTVTTIASELKEDQLVEQLRRAENLNITLISHNLTERILRASLIIENVGSVQSKVKYIVIACFVPSGQVKSVDVETHIEDRRCTYALTPGEARNCTIAITLENPCRYAVLTFVTAYGNSYSVVLR